MNGIQRGKGYKHDKPFPGCLGRMVGLFDLSEGMSRHRLLTERSHDDGSLSRSESDVERSFSTIRDQMENVSEFRSSSNKVSNGNPTKKLFAQEMSVVGEAKHNSPNVVAKLMGLDALPQQRADFVKQRRHSRSYSWHSPTISSTPCESWQEEQGISERQMNCEALQHQDGKHTGAFEIWHLPQRTDRVRNTYPQKEKANGNIDERNMALIRQKFMEAKRLSTDEKLRQSKEFQDALDVLSSNKDLFLKFLQEPNSLFSGQLGKKQSIPPPLETKRITVLKPSKMVDDARIAGFEKKSENQVKKPSQVSEMNGRQQNNTVLSPPLSNWKIKSNHAQPTRIVVLKPSPGSAPDDKSVLAPPPSSLPGEFLQTRSSYNESDDETHETREVTKKITRQMREDLSTRRRDESLLSSVFSNGYVCDESSFSKSDNEYADGNLTDTEIMSPISRRSWDSIDRFSPCSSSYLSRASCSPESSVCREAKRRLSERWAVMASNNSSLEQNPIWRSSNTLGEMLALSENPKSLRSEDSMHNKGEKPSKLVPVSSPRDLPRSKSVPVSSTVYGTELNAEVSDTEGGKTNNSKEQMKAKSTKSSFKGKVSSLFFSRTKKSSKNNPSASQAENPGFSVHVHEKSSDTPHSAKDNSHLSSPSLQESSSKGSPISCGPTDGNLSCEAGFSAEKPAVPGCPGESQDQPSPVSVLESLFDEDDNSNPEFHGNANLDCQRNQPSNLIGKSPPIESIARTLLWDDFNVGTSDSSFVPLGFEENLDWFFLVRTLLSEAGLDGGVQLDTYFARWHSLESPLDPRLRERYTDMNVKLVFDSVNAALVDIAGSVSETGLVCSGARDRLPRGQPPALADCVWARMKEWFLEEAGRAASNGGEGDSLVAERVVRKEVGGREWAREMRAEADCFGREMEKKVLEELVEEAVVELTGKPSMGLLPSVPFPW